MRLPALLLSPLFFLCLPAFGQRLAVGSSGSTPDRLALSGEYTIRYQAMQRDVRPQQLVEKIRKETYENSINIEFYEATGRHLQPNEPVPPQVRQKANQDAEAATRRFSTPQPVIITLAGRGNTFAYQLLTTGDPKTSLQRGATIPPQLLTYNGTNSVHHFYTDQRYDTSPNFSSADLPLLPVFCARLSSITLIKDVQQTGGGVYEGKSFIPGSAPLNGVVFYYPARIKVSEKEGTLRIDEIAFLRPDGQPRAVCEMSDFRRFKGIWLPAKVKLTNNYDSPSGQLLPGLVDEFTLIDASEKPAEASLYEPLSHLLKKDIIQDNTGAETVVFSYNPNKSLDVQKRDAFLRVKEKKTQFEEGTAGGRTRSGLYALMALILGGTSWLIWRKSHRTA